MSMFAILSAPKAFADQTSCTPIDYSSTLGPSRDQGTAGWCFAFAAADLLTNYLSSSSRVVRISAFDIAWTINQFNSAPPPPNSYVKPAYIGTLAQQYDADSGPYGVSLSKRAEFGGDTSTAVWAMLARGHACLEEKVPSENSITFINQRDFLKKKISNFEHRNSKEGSGQVFDGLTATTPNEFADQIPAEYFQYANEVQARSLTSSLARACGNGVRLPKFYPIVENLDSYPEEELFNFLNILLSAGEIAAVDIDGCRLQEEAPQSFVKVNSACGHVATVIGRRWNPTSQICEYKLRTSWGTRSCSAYQTGLISDCRQGEGWITPSGLRNIQMSAVTGFAPGKIHSSN